MIAALLDRLRQGDRNALARLISLAAQGEGLAELQASLAANPRSARVVAFTGSGGVGKSTLIGKLIPLVRSQGHKVAVLACDPQSPLSGGALLGDRFRMGSSTDDGVFIRSLAAQSGHGALADHLDVMIRLFETVGFEVIFLETVGAGQGDVEVRRFSDVVVLMLQPETGDDVQWEKAGILECADIVVVHKADLPTTEQTAAQVRAALDLSPARHVPVLRVSTKANTGHAELWQTIHALPLRRQHATAASLLLESAIAWFKERYQAAESRHDAELVKLIEAWQRGETPTEIAAQSLLNTLTRAKP
ncbi:MAG: methylmalonyl Co-A mutase-associated GTPase MeaB [Gemmataceae bacterium]|nr:methylmalonyl Co-A mutase-associated GTPase MeaB [Gemmataceae bacterium]